MLLRCASKFFMILPLAFLHLPLLAQIGPRPYLGAEVRGQVVEAATGRPIDGAIVVARWDWLGYRSALEGSGFYANGDAVHVGEALTDREGRYSIAGWGPVLRAGGKMDEKAPNLIVFKPGYEPLQRPLAGDATLKLKTFTGTPKEYAQAIARIQGADYPGYGESKGGLGWQYPGDNAKAMPRMVAALHREKVRLGEDGAAIRGANLISGRSGEGELVDSATKQAVTPALVWIAWTMRRVDGSPGARRLVQVKRSGAEHGSNHFYVSPWRLPAPELPGWEIDPDATPRVRIYARGFRRSAEMPWDGKGAVVALQKLPAGRDAALAEMRAMRADIDTELARNSSDADLAAQRLLLEQLVFDCREITPDLRAGICYPSDSPVALYLDRTRGHPTFMRETAEGGETIRVVAAGGSQLQAQSVAVPAGPPAQRARVGGFTIEPAR
jgi:hypothetical protein